jgi:glycosyltransferase involved in cell wall biosynthesis
MSWYIPKMGYQENFLAAEQKKLGVNVEIITSDRVPEYKGYERNVGSIIGGRIIGTGIFEENNVKIHRLPSLFEMNGQILLKGLIKKLKQLKPDIVQAHGAFSPLTLQVILCSTYLNYSVFVDDHSHETNFYIDSLATRMYIILIKLFYFRYGNRVCFWMPVTYSAKQILQSVLKIPDNKITLLPLGADQSRFKKSKELRKIGRNESGIKDDSLLILSSGKFDERKDIYFLIKAFEKVCEEYPNIYLLLLGSGSEEYIIKLKDMINSAGLDSNVIFKNFVPNSELSKYYNAADIGVWPGDPSITVIEAVATGLPVIIPKNDPAYQVLVESNQNMRYKLIENNLNLVEKTLSWNKVAEKSISIYLSRDHKDVFKN